MPGTGKCNHQQDTLLNRVLGSTYPVAYLYHIDLGIEDNSRTIVKKNKDLTGLRQEQSVHDKALEGARADQAKTRT
jgi:structural maintenance of chromosome 1